MTQTAPPPKSETEEQLYADLNSPSPAVPMQGLVERARDYVADAKIADDGEAPPVFKDPCAILWNLADALEQAGRETERLTERENTLVACGNHAVKSIEAFQATIEQLEREVEGLRGYLRRAHEEAGERLVEYLNAQVMIASLLREVENGTRS